MKFLSLHLIFGILALAAGDVRAQNYAVNWHKISGGGGTSTGGTLSVSGTIGQPDASGAATGGKYAVTGGFWSLYAVQTPGAPVLTIYLSGGNTAIVAWLAPASGYVLQENFSLANTNWINSAASISVVNGTNQVSVTPPAGNKFFRLYHP